MAFETTAGKTDIAGYFSVLSRLGIGIRQGQVLEFPEYRHGQAGPDKICHQVDGGVLIAAHVGIRYHHRSQKLHKLIQPANPLLC